MQYLIYQSFEKCEPEHRKELFTNIQVVGGGSAFTNFHERLQKELMDYDAFGYANRLRVSTTQDREEKFVKCSFSKVFKLVGSEHHGVNVQL